MKAKHFTLLFIIVVIFEMLGGLVYEFKLIPYGIWLFKPLLMPVLMYWYYKESKLQSSFDKIIMASLFFSWWGDNFLMPAIFKTDINFLLGLASFLVAHLLYIAAFVKTNIQNQSILKSKPYLVIPFVLIGVGLISYLMQQNFSEFNEIKFPVILYATVIMVMVIAALNRWGKTSYNSFKYVFIGAILFMISDSIIALSKFSNLFNGYSFVASILIITIYTSGQYYIIKGSILQAKEGKV